MRWVIRITLRPSWCAKSPHCGHQVEAGLVVEERGSLVQQQMVGPGGDRTGDRQALLLPGGQLVRVGKPQMDEAEQLQAGEDALLHGARIGLQVLQAEGDFVLHHRADNLVLGVLEDHPDVLMHRPAGRAGGGGDAIDQDGAGMRQEQPAHQLGERRLAGAIGTQDGHDLPIGDLQIDGVDRGLEG